MAKVDPYHTVEEEYGPKHRDVYHNHDDCHDGKAIKKEHKKSGKDGRKQCKVCIGLD